MPMNVDGEGSPFDLAQTHHDLWQRHSDGRRVFAWLPIEDPRWIRRSPHEAPPTQGILALYNRGDRRRWYWKCEHCGEWFEPSFDLLRVAGQQDVLECAGPRP